MPELEGTAFRRGKAVDDATGEALRPGWSAEQLEAIGRLAGIAHDFNNLLLIIGASAEFINVATPVGDARREDIRQIREAVDKAAELTWQLLMFSRSGGWEE